MEKKRSLLGLIGTVCLSLALVGCGESDDTSASSAVDDDGSGTTGSETKGGASAGSDGEDVVEIFSWWIAPGEIEALQSLFALHKANHDGARILNAAETSGTDAKAVLTERLEANDPPDLFQENANDLRRRVEENPNKYASLDSLFEDEGWKDSFVPEVLADVSVNGEVYGLPVNMHRENALFYNKQIFDANGLSAPETMAEFWAACDTLKAAGITPVATSNQGWIQRIMFNSIALGVMGPEAYNDFFTGQTSGDDPKFIEALDAMERLLTDYTNENAGDADFGWTEAAQAMYDGDAAMFFHGDWAKGYVQQLGWTPGVDFGAVGSPGASDAFLYGTDTFAMPEGGPNPEGAIEFLKTIASVDGQVAFNKIKGSSPVRTDVAANKLDPVAARTHADLTSATLRMGVPLYRDVDEVFGGELAGYDDAFAKFANDRDREALDGFFAQTYPGR